MSSTETRYLLPSRRRWPDATYCAFTKVAAAAGVWLRSEKAVPRAMTLMLRNLAKPKMMSLATLSASATLSGAAVNGINRSVATRVTTACRPDEASKTRDADQTHAGRLRKRPLCCRKSGLERCRVNAFGLKARYRCIDLVFGLGIQPAAQQRANELNVNRFVERRDLEALPQYFNAIIAFRRQDGAESFE
jgi:hypothetical protein